jgi:uncharacterized membrane protein required for colicin V production
MHDAHTQPAAAHLVDNQHSHSHPFSRQGFCFITPEMQALSKGGDIISAVHINYFDLAVVIWLIVGIFRGRKHGMSQELLPLVQWIAVIVATSFLYLPLARLMVQRLGLTLLPCALLSYVFIGCFVYALLGKLKKKLDDTFQEGDYFGDGEYYLGMVSGVIRFACILVAGLALLNSRIVTKAEREATVKMQAQAFESIQFPTFGEVQNVILLESGTGNLVRAYLPHFLIAPVNYNDAPPPRTIGKMRALAVTSTSSHTANTTAATSSGNSSGGGLKISFNH